MSQGVPSRRAQGRGGFHWDKSTLEQRRRARLQRLERDNYTALPEFDNMAIAAEGEGTAKRPGRPRSEFSAPKPNTLTIVVGTAEEGLKRANRKETRQLAAHRRTFADVLANETDGDAAKCHGANESSNTYYYLTCIT
ncbi:hypothetical protein GGI02_001637, partial [Coemansia sp. RSA 2322]